MNKAAGPMERERGAWRAVIGAVLLAASLSCAHAASVTILYDFKGGADGAGPSGPLTFDGNGTIYGTTSFGGERGHGCSKAGCGSVFSFDPATGIKTTLHNFVAKSGSAPQSGVVFGPGNLLFGTTFGGGSYGGGVVFSLDPSAGTLRVLHTFNKNGDGYWPTSGVVAGRGDALYGTTSSGGAPGYGTVFKIDVASGQETILHSFGGPPDGEYAYGGLTPGPGGKLFGTTETGGANADGTVFSIYPATGAETLVTSLGQTPGLIYPKATLSADAAGMLYGTTEYGDVFEVNSKTGAVTGLFSTGAIEPCNNPVVLDGNAMIYGSAVTTEAGTGVVVAYDESSQTTATLWNMRHPNQGKGVGALTWHAGALYGAASGGGMYNKGLLFKITP